MHNLAPSFWRFPRRSFTAACLGATVSTLLLAGGCVEPAANDLSACVTGQNCAAVGGAGGGLGSGGTGLGTGGGVLGSGGANGGTGGAFTSGGTGGGQLGSGGLGNGSGGQLGSGGGSGGEPCVDAPAPYDETWPEATCESWANEANACGESWFAQYCDISCGRCTPTNTGSGGAPGVDCSTNTELPDVQGGEGFATRYWDCCQTHCAQFDGHKCNKDGTSRTGDNTSSCQGGGSFACYDEAPHAVSDCLSYGYVAKANPNCGGCYRMEFTGQGHDNPNDAGSKLIKGKQMIVKVSNTGSDVNGNQFDLMIPGGGVGIYNACSNQWNVQNTADLGAQYGGFLAACSSGTHAAKKDCVRAKCELIPEGEARDGCYWFVDWFQIADNPTFTSTQTECPF